MRAFIGALLLVTVPATAQTHVVQPFKFLWDYAATADRFEFKLDAGGYVNVGLPPLVGGSFAMQADPTLTGSHSAVVRACLLAVCTADSNIVSFIVDQGPPNAVRLAVGSPPVESPSGTNLTLPNVGSIIDSIGAVWTLGPKNPSIDGGLWPTKARNGVVDGSAAVLCYSVHSVNARGDLAGGWWKWTDNAALPAKGSWSLVSAPAGCL